MSEVLRPGSTTEPREWRPWIRCQECDAIAASDANIVDRHLFGRAGACPDCGANLDYWRFAVLMVSIGRIKALLTEPPFSTSPASFCPFLHPRHRYGRLADRRTAAGWRRFCFTSERRSNSAHEVAHRRSVHRLRTLARSSCQSRAAAR